MKLIVISPPDEHPSERAVLADLFAAGLERYHVRKPAWTRERLADWLAPVPAADRARLVVHQHHELARQLGLGGCHWPDAGPTQPASPLSSASGLSSRSCHDLAGLRGALGHFDSVFFSPVYPSLSKPGYAPADPTALAAVAALLADRPPAAHRTDVIALGGITAERIPAVRALGFDGVAVIGAVWQAPDPRSAFAALQDALLFHAA
jgi:thiamine-phosphate pyrophosphorylase